MSNFWVGESSYIVDAPYCFFVFDFLTFVFRRFSFIIHEHLNPLGNCSAHWKASGLGNIDVMVLAHAVCRYRRTLID